MNASRTVTPAPRSARRTAALAAGSILAIPVLGAAAMGLGHLTGSWVAGVLLVLATFAACALAPSLPAWARQLPSRLHPAPRRRKSQGRDPGLAGQILTGAGAA